jgi:hypothetical protein
MLESLILQADDEILSILGPDSKEYDEYFNVTT